PERRAVSFRYPVAHLAQVRRKFQFDRGGAGEPCVSNRGHIFPERGVPSPGRQVAVIDAVAIGDVNLGDPAFEPPERGRGNAHQPEMRDVDGRLDIREAHLVEETFHIVQRSDEREIEWKQLDRKLQAPFRGVPSDLLGGVDHELPLALRWQQAMLEHVLAGDKAKVPRLRKLDGKVEDIFRALNVIGADSRVEVAETQTGANERVDGHIGAANAGDIVAAFRRSHSGRIKTDEEVEAVEPDGLGFLPSGPPLVLRAEPGRIDQAQLPLRIGAHWIVLPGQNDNGRSISGARARRTFARPAFEAAWAPALDVAAKLAPAMEQALPDAREASDSEAAARLIALREQIARRARDCGRAPESVKLVAVSKTFS